MYLDISQETNNFIRQTKNYDLNLQGNPIVNLNWIKNRTSKWQVLGLMRMLIIVVTMLMIDDDDYDDA